MTILLPMLLGSDSFFRAGQTQEGYLVLLFRFGDLQGANPALLRGDYKHGPYY